MKTALSLVALMPLLASASSGRTPSDPLAPLDFLLGSWRTSTSNAGAGDVFKRDLDGHVLMRTSRSDVRGPDGKVTGSLQGMMTVYADTKGASLRAIYFDSVGHVIHYKLADAVPGRSARFASDGTDPGPLFRVTYAQIGPKTLHVTFETATPDRPTVFSVVAEGDERPAS